MRRQLYIFIPLLAFAACKKDVTIWDTENLNGNKISVFGHGGMGTKYHYPMNSMQSLNDALQLGADGTEMDVQLSKDNVLALYHSINLQDGTGCSGKIADHNWEEIKDCDYQAPIFAKAGLISADEFFAQRPSFKNHVFTFDTKVEVRDPKELQDKFADALYDLIRKYGLEENCFIESYSTYFLKALYAKNNQLKLFVHSDTFADALEVLENVKLYGITMDRTRISAEDIREAHIKGLRVALFNLETEDENLEGIKMNPDFMQTDKCDYLLNALE